MSEVTIRYVQRVMGRSIGAEERVEHTDFVKALVANYRVEVIEVHADPEPVATPEEAMAATLTKPGRIGDSRRKLADSES